MYVGLGMFLDRGVSSRAYRIEGSREVDLKIGIVPYTAR